ncbi:MAG: hypothetical protein QGH11_04665 [Pirellulaceae bacterium]|nr:hypothetical protein [Pirellulaceae bacterium]
MARIHWLPLFLLSCALPLPALSAQESPPVSQLGVDVVTLADGQQLRGVVYSRSQKGELVLAVDRSWVKEALPGLYSRQQQLEKQRQEQAHRTSSGVARQAGAVAKQAEEVYRTVGKMDFSVADFHRPAVAPALREFEQRFKALHGAVQKAVDEYLQGDTLVMDLIVKFQLDKRTVRHGLSVAAFATEMASHLALKGRDYLGV